MAEVQGIALGPNQDGRLELVVTVDVAGLSPGSEGSVWHLREHPRLEWPPRYQALEMPSMVGFGGPAVARNRDGRLEVAVTTMNQLLHSWQTASNGRTWRFHSLGHPSDQTHQPIATQPPALARNKDGRLEAFVMEKRGTFSNGPLWHIWQQAGGGWSPWHSLGAPDSGVLIGPPVVASNRDGRLEVFGLGSDGLLWHIWQQVGGGWSRWHSLDAPEKVDLPVRPAVARNRDGRLEVFVLGSDRAVWHIWQRAGGGWSPWDSLESEPGRSFFQVAAGAHADGRLVVFVLAAPSSSGASEGNAVWQREQAVEGGWSPWRSFPRPFGPEVRDPALALGADQQLQLWARIPGTVHLYQLKQGTVNGTEWDHRVWGFVSPDAPAFSPTPADDAPA
jgi:hypothetical protein